MSILPLAPVKRVAEQGGADRVGNDATEALALGAEEWIKKTVAAAQKYAKHAGRKTLKAEDVIVVVKEQGIMIQLKPVKQKSSTAKKSAAQKPAKPAAVKPETKPETKPAAPITPTVQKPSQAAPAPIAKPAPAPAAAPAPKQEQKPSQAAAPAPAAAPQKLPGSLQSPLKVNGYPPISSMKKIDDKDQYI